MFSMIYRYYALASLSDSLLIGEGNFLEKLVTDRLEEFGRVWLKQKVAEATGFDFLRRTKRAYTTGGMSEIRRARNRLLAGSSLAARSGFIGRGLRDIASGFNTEINRVETEVVGSDVRRAVVDRMEHALVGDEQDRGNGTGTGGRSGQSWSSARQEWLKANDAPWRHNWESQPRDPHGRWKAGRLKHPYMTKGARKIRTKRRIIARNAARESWRDNQ
jgi:hypothetical protein